jgi:hypothetical protein
MDHELGEAFVGEAVHAGTEPILNGADGALDLADVAVRRHDVHDNRTEVGTEALELMVRVDVANSKSTRVVEAEDRFGLA